MTRLRRETRQLCDVRRSRVTECLPIMRAAVGRAERVRWRHERTDVGGRRRRGSEQVRRREDGRTEGWHGNGSGSKDWASVVVSIEIIARRVDVGWIVQSILVEWIILVIRLEVGVGVGGAHGITRLVIGQATRARLVRVIVLARQGGRMRMTGVNGGLAPLGADHLVGFTRVTRA